MRIVLFTGKGGVGKSTVAAGTAALAAGSGRRTLVLSTDAAHSLGDALGADVGPEPTLVAPGLWAQQVDAQLRFEESWAEIQRYLLAVLDAAGVDAVAAGELAVLPGAEEVLALLELRRRVLATDDGADGPWDLVVVDCAPTAETLRLLALPEALGWYLDRVLPAERRLVKALRPVLTRAAGVPMPDDDVFDALERLHADLDDVRRLLTGPDASVRVVLTPESVVLAEARRSWTTLSLFGYNVDGVVANRIFPAGGSEEPAADDWRAGWVAAQHAVLAEAEASFPGLPLWRSTYRAREPVGLAELTALAADAYGADDPFAPVAGGAPFSLDPGTGPGAETVLRLALPGAVRDAVDLARRGDELVVTVGPYRRLLALPSGLSGRTVLGAGVVDGELRVRFAPAVATAAAGAGRGSR